eukprot:TRINITY_DN13021_c0_g1_i2.p1 TRINITY_DN13021_c0_g1~~TRINITY_DN13021_c0_g1_i2.p1  ORF type:complete len:251 (+),score=35.35 TRINITY_DN13021_c0_g1_i2:111-863(+)
MSHAQPPLSSPTRPGVAFPVVTLHQSRVAVTSPSTSVPAVVFIPRPTEVLDHDNYPTPTRRPRPPCPAAHQPATPATPIRQAEENEQQQEWPGREGFATPPPVRAIPFGLQTPPKPLPGCFPEDTREQSAGRLDKEDVAKEAAEVEVQIVLDSGSDRMEEDNTADTWVGPSRMCGKCTARDGAAADPPTASGSSTGRCKGTRQHYVEDPLPSVERRTLPDRKAKHDIRYTPLRQRAPRKASQQKRPPWLP